MMIMETKQSPIQDYLRTQKNLHAYNNAQTKLANRTAICMHLAERATYLNVKLVTSMKYQIYMLKEGGGGN